ncbi:hypothetical protein C5C41_06720 [Rathayibacter sp. AY1E9]|uniref:hypothetical protein n=1 Tax=Rathayibacter sp. AY1E9 TaxID=2080556 RepID=UPI000CE87ACD|nr:hypothetical protein [Rathayibacter sp. AY1E9]PPG53412.1 hypothetical protein C5C41_06720 [Rathayibacter sp. AY1E9]
MSPEERRELKAKLAAFELVSALLADEYHLLLNHDGAIDLVAISANLERRTAILAEVELLRQSLTEPEVQEAGDTALDRYIAGIPPKHRSHRE